MASGREPVDPWALISAEEQASIKKMSDVRLREKLGGAGVQQAKLDAMDRTALLEEWARLGGFIGFQKIILKRIANETACQTEAREVGSQTEGFANINLTLAKVIVQQADGVTNECTSVRVA